MYVLGGRGQGLQALDSIFVFEKNMREPGEAILAQNTAAQQEHRGSSKRRTCFVTIALHYPGESIGERLTPMAEPVATQENHAEGEIPEQQPPPAPLEPAAATAGAEAPVGRNEALEAAIRHALEGSTKDLGRLCKTLGESFCLPSTRPARAVGYDSGSDTTAPADQEHSSSSESGIGSETCGEACVSTSTGPTIGLVGKGKGSKELEDGNVRAVAAAAEVRDGVAFARAQAQLLLVVTAYGVFGLSSCCVVCLVLVLVSSRAEPCVFLSSFFIFLLVFGFDF